MNLNVGIDVGKYSLYSTGITSDTTMSPVFRDETENTADGAAHIKQLILDWISTQPKGSVKQIVIGMEATSIYHLHPLMYFIDDDDLKAYDTLVVQLNPKVTHQFNKVTGDEKTDRKDSLHIAEQLRAGYYDATLCRSEEYLALQRLTRERSAIVDQLADAKNHYLNNLYFKLNTAEKELETSVFTTTMLKLLSGDEYSLAQIGRMPLDELTALIVQYSRGGYEDPRKLAKELKKSISNSYSLSKVVADSIDLVLGTYFAQIRMYVSQIKQMETSISQLAETLVPIRILQSIPGIGPVFAAGIVAEIGQLERFSSESKLAKYAGLYWKRNQSGSFEQEVKHRPKTGDKYLRYYLVEAADSVRKRDQVFADFYAKKYKEVNNHQAHRACILTARKLVRVIYSLLESHQLYTPAY